MIVLCKLCHNCINAVAVLHIGAAKKYFFIVFSWTVLTAIFVYCLYWYSYIEMHVLSYMEFSAAVFRTLPSLDMWI